MSSSVTVNFGSVPKFPGTSLALRTRTLTTGNHSIARFQNDLRRLGITPTEAAIDFLTVALAVQAADLASLRRTSQDGWTRELHVEVPVTDREGWCAAKQLLIETLGFLTGDLWQFTFVKRASTAAELGFAAAAGSKPCISDAVQLFSGGLDSCIGAIDALESGATPILISCQNEPATNRAQLAVLKQLHDAYPSKIRRVALNTQFAFEGAKEESSQRSRSFLFLAAATMVASGISPVPAITVPENGLIALNIPLDFTRLGSLSTRTTHPMFLHGFEQLLNAIGLGIALRNPYEFKTKGQMMQSCLNQAVLATIAPKTVSCGKANVANIQHCSHCGSCVPCIIRRAAFHAAHVNDTTTYVLSDLAAVPLNANELAGFDVRAFKSACASVENNPGRAFIDVRRSGYLGNEPQMIERYANLYLEGMSEVGDFLRSVRTVRA